MRNILYTLGILVASVGILLVFDASAGPAPSDMAIVVTAHAAMATQRMLIVVCGVVLFVGGAIVHAIERVEKVQLAIMPRPLPPQQWMPPPGGPPMGPG